MPKVTVLMAVYNCEQYLREAVESILGQTFQDFDFLIINDGSTDSTREVILSYDDPRIRLVDNEQNLGLTRSLNRGLELAQGEFIARQDGDDISEPERLSKQVTFLEAHPEVALLGTWYKKIDAQGNLIGLRDLPCDSTQILWGILFFCPLIHSSIMLRKSPVLNQVGFYNESFSYAQDYELWSRISQHFPVGNLNEYLVRYRVNPSSMTATYGVKVSDEPLCISTANIQHLLNLIGWNKNKEKMLDEQQIRTMIKLFLGFCDGLSTEDIGKAAEAILSLHTGFCQYYKVDRLQSKTTYAKLCNHISGHLINLVYNYFYQDNTIAWRLFVRASLINRSLFFKKSYTRLFCKLLIGPRLVKTIGNFNHKVAN